MSVICRSADGAPPGKSISGLWMSISVPLMVARSVAARAARAAVRPGPRSLRLSLCGPAHGRTSTTPRTPILVAKDLEILFDKCWLSILLDDRLFLAEFSAEPLP